jgi:hypothetical protein
MECLKTVRTPFLLGLTLLLPPAMMYEFAGRVPLTGASSRHGIVLTFGYALMTGSVAYGLYLASRNARLGLPVMRLVVTLFLALGVFFHNVNLDLYLKVADEQKRF